MMKLVVIFEYANAGLQAVVGEAVGS